MGGPNRTVSGEEGSHVICYFLLKFVFQDIFGPEMAGH